MATTKSADLPHLRSVVLAGHSGAGKTTLAEALLFRTGAINRLGRVEDGTTSLDTEPEEQKRHISLSLAVASLDDDGNVVTIVDTPGYPDFVAEVVAGFQAADAARHLHGRDGRRRSGHGDGRRARPGQPDGRPVRRSTSAIARTPSPAAVARRAARGVRQQDRAAPGRHRQGRDASAAMSTSSTARPTTGMAARRSRSRSRPRWRPRSPRAATSSSRPPPRPTTTS